MKILITIFLLISVTNTINAQNENPNYNEALAQELGADAYGMKIYVLAILKTGINQDADPETVQQSFAGHMENINRLVEEDKLIVAGPMMANENQYRGIFILDVSTLEEAEELLQTDPAIQEKLLDVDLFRWYGSAALAQYLEAADQIWQQKP
jgi:uncharacterized protein YciI